jgi:Glyoxalase/Bleomycin resistance protein/Dioxygenase superfamily
MTDACRRPELHVIEQKDLPVARQGAGAVHHIAFRTPDEEQNHARVRRLTELGIPNSGEIDRFYFRSLRGPHERRGGAPFGSDQHDRPQRATNVTSGGICGASRHLLSR